MNLRAFLVAYMSEILGETFAKITVLHCFLDWSSKASFIIWVNFDCLYGMWYVFSWFRALKALFLVHSARDMRERLMSFVSAIKLLSWYFWSPMFSEPAKSKISSWPVYIDGNLVFEKLILHTEWVLLDVSFLKVALVALLDLAISFNSRNCSADLITSSRWPCTSISPNVSSPNLIGFSSLIKSVTSCPRIWKKQALISISGFDTYLFIKSWGIRSRRPCMVYVLPVPVCPWAKIELIPPPKLKSINGPIIEL